MVAGGVPARSMALLFLLAGAGTGWVVPSYAADISTATHGVAVLLVDTDRVTGTIDEGIYGQFLEHINHSVVDGLFAEQIRAGLRRQGLRDYWKPFAEQGSVELVDVKFENGEQERAPRGRRRHRRHPAGPHLRRRPGHEYDGSRLAQSRAGHGEGDLRVLRDSDGKLDRSSAAGDHRHRHGRRSRYAFSSARHRRGRRRSRSSPPGPAPCWWISSR